MPDISDFLPKEVRELEWYDNSTLATIDKCARKGYWKNIFVPPSLATGNPNEPHKPKAHQAGLAESVGVGAYFGTAIHEALDKYYAPANSHLPDEKRRIMSMRAFSSKYAQLVMEPHLVETKYSHPRGIDILDMYFDHYHVEDQSFRIVETEVVGIIVVRPRKDEPNFTPFIWIIRTDGLIERLGFQDYMVMEHKTAGSPEQKLVELRISRQTEGYVWGMKEFPHARPIKGILANVIATRAAEVEPTKLFYRDYIYKSDYQTEQWRLETIWKVLRWRKMISLASSTPNIVEAMLYFGRNTEECTRYGRCSFYDLCLHGPHNVDLSKFSPNDWNPLYTETGDA